MSFADELRQAEAKLKAQLEQESSKKKTGSKRKATTRTAKTSASSWKIEDDIIALYLQMTEASKFFKENYSKKRKVPQRAMVRKMEVFRDMFKGRKNTDITDQMKTVFDEFAGYDAPDLQKIVIAILRGEYTYAGGLTKSNQEQSPVVRKPEL